MRHFVVLALLAAATPAASQVMQQPNETLLQQLVPESFPLRATAVAAKADYFRWETTVNYTLANNSGMNLYLGIAMRTVTIGACAEAYAARGGLPLLPVAGMGVYSAPIGAGPPRAAFVPAGANIAGTIVVDRCEAPNPGSPTAPLAMSLLLGSTQNVRAMVQFPISTVAPIRRIAAP